MLAARRRRRRILADWIVLRGLCFTAAVGRRPSRASCSPTGWASPPRSAARRGAAVRARRRRARRRGPGGHDSPRRSCSSPRSPLGVVLASDVFHSAASVETLLFGSLLLTIGTGGRAAAVGVAVLRAGKLAARRALAARRLRPRQRPARSACARSPLPDVAAARARRARGRRGAGRGRRAARHRRCSSCRPLRRACWSTALRTWQLATVAARGAGGRVGLWLAVKANAPPGATIAVVGGGAFALVALARAVAGRRLVAGVAGAVTRERRAAAAPTAWPSATGGPPGAARRQLRRCMPASASPCSAPTAAARRRCSARCSASCARRPGRCALRRAAAACRRPSARGWTSPSARSTSR